MGDMITNGPMLVNPRIETKFLVLPNVDNSWSLLSTQTINGQECPTQLIKVFTSQKDAEAAKIKYMEKEKMNPLNYHSG